MASAIKRTFHLDVEHFDLLMQQSGMTLEDLAAKSGIDLRTLRRKRKGEPAFLSTLREIARGLATTTSSLISQCDGQASTIPDRHPSRFRARLKLSGKFHSARQKEFLIRLNNQIMSDLAHEGITVTGQSFTIATTPIASAGALRLVLAVRSVTDNMPSWFLATVKPSLLSDFCQAEEIDGTNFPFGEVLIAGWGRAIPRSVYKRASNLLRCRSTQILDESDLRHIISANND